MAMYSAWLNPKANLRVFVDSSGRPLAFCYSRLLLEAGIFLRRKH